MNESDFDMIIEFFFWLLEGIGCRRITGRLLAVLDEDVGLITLEDFTTFIEFVLVVLVLLQFDCEMNMVESDWTGSDGTTLI